MTENSKAVPASAVIILVIATAAYAQIPLEYSPYKIDVFIAIGDPGNLNGVSRDALNKQMVQLAESQVGAAWTLTARTAEGALFGEMSTRLNAILPAQLVELTPVDPARDKAMYVLLQHSNSRWNVTVRELDFRTYNLSPLVVRNGIEHSRLADGILEAVVAAFSPVAELDSAASGVITGKLQAALLIIDDDSPVLIADGEPLTPIVRRNDRLGRASTNDVAVLPWTVLIAISTDGAKLTCQIHSGQQNPLGGKSRLRLQRYAQATRYADRETTLTLQTPGDDAKPLVSYEIVRREESGDVTVIGRTDESGRTKLPANDSAWQMLYVRHGDRFLARLPIVSGWNDAYTVPLPSDDIRLAAEGFVSSFRQEIIDTVARRQILTTRIRDRIAAGQFDEAERLVSQFRQLAGARQFAQRLDTARGELVADNARAQQLIDQMFSETRQVLDRYLDPAQADALAAQLARARTEG